MDDVLAKLLEAKERSGYSYSDLANATGVPKSTIQRYFTGHIGKLPLDFVEKICRAMQIEPRTVLGWDYQGTAENSKPPDTTVGSVPQTPQARILASGIDKMPERDRERALNLVMMMFEQYADYFERSDDDDPNA